MLRIRLADRFASLALPCLFLFSLHSALAVDKDDPGVARELGVVSEYVERWPDALFLYELVWWDEPELVDGHSDTARDNMRMLKAYAPQMHYTLYLVENGLDDIANHHLYFHYPTTNRFDVGANYWYRDLDGPGLIGFPHVDEEVWDGDLHLTYRPGHGFKFIGGVLYADNPATFIWGAKLGIGYRQEDWNTTLTGTWREHWVDPLDVVPWGSAKDTLLWTVAWSPYAWLNLYGNAKAGNYYLLEPPIPNEEDVYTSWGWMLGGEIRVICVPQLWAFYNYDYLDGDTETVYQPLIALLEERRGHTLGLRFYHDLCNCFTVFAACSFGHDEARDLDLFEGDLLTYSGGFIWRLSDMLEFQVRHLHSSETTTGQAADYDETAAQVIMRF